MLCAVIAWGHHRQMELVWTKASGEFSQKAESSRSVSYTQVAGVLAGICLFFLIRRGHLLRYSTDQALQECACGARDDAKPSDLNKGSAIRGTRHFVRLSGHGAVEPPPSYRRLLA